MAGKARQGTAWHGEAGQALHDINKTMPKLNNKKGEKQKMGNTKITKLKALIEGVRLRHGILTPEILLNEAENPQNPLHKYFQWNNEKAAHEYRLIQARALIQRVTVKIADPEDGEKMITIRSYVSLPGERKDGQYRHIAEVLSNEDMKAQYIESVREELSAFKHKMQNISQVITEKFDDLMNELEATQKSFKRKKAV